MLTLVPLGWGTPYARPARLIALLPQLHSTVRRMHLIWLVMGGLLLLLTGCTSVVYDPPTPAPSTPPPQAGAPAVTPTQSFADLAQRALQIPQMGPQAACPVTPPQQARPAPDFGIAVGAGPVYAVGEFARTGVLTDGGDPDADGWRSYKVLWIGAPSYAGPVFIRGRQLDGPNELRFEHGQPDLRFQPPSDGGWSPSGWYNWPIYTQLSAGGVTPIRLMGGTSAT